MAREASGLGAQLAKLANMKDEAQQLVGTLVKKMESVVEILSKADQVLGEFQEQAGGLAVRKGKVGRPKGKGKVGRPPSAGKPSNISAALKAYRDNKGGINQEALAKELAVHVASIRAWEQGRSIPRKGMLAKMAKLGIDVGNVTHKPRKPRKTRKAPRAKAGEKVAPEATQKVPEGEKKEEGGS